MIRKKRSAGSSQAAIFKAAAVEFAERGYDATGVDRIARRARVNKAMIYYHFGSKQGLYHEILREMFRSVGARGRAIAAGAGTAPQKMNAWLEAIMQEASARPWFPPIMLRELAAGGAHFDAETFSLMNGVYAAVRDIIVQGQREQVFADVDPLLTHLTIMPAILIFFARQRVIATTKQVQGVAAPRQVHDFVQHMQRSIKRMLRNDL